MVLQSLKYIVSFRATCHLPPLPASLLTRAYLCCEELDFERITQTRDLLGTKVRLLLCGYLLLYVSCYCSCSCCCSYMKSLLVSYDCLFLRMHVYGIGYI